jgi:uncharacterized protein YigE (DUF2233 family)
MCQTDSCTHYTVEMDAIQDMIAKMKEANNPAKMQEWDKKYQKLKIQHDSCIAKANRKNTQASQPSPAVVNTPVQTSSPVIPHKSEFKVDTAKKDNKVPPATALTNKKPDPKKSVKVPALISTKSATKDTTPKTSQPANKPVTKDTTPQATPQPELQHEKGLDYNQKVDTLDHGVTTYKVRIGNKVFDYIVVDLDKSDIQLHLHYHGGKLKDHNFGSLANLLNSGEVNREKVEMLTNGGMYMHDGQPQGLYIENKKHITPIDTSDPKNGDNFHLMPNGVFFVKNGNAEILTTDSYKKSELEDSSISIATQSGPMLVIDGKRHPVFTEGSHNEKLRSGVCVVNKKTVVFAICDQINFWDFANFFKDYIKGPNALFLDGAVSRMYFREKGVNGHLRRDPDGNFGAIISVTAK